MHTQLLVIGAGTAGLRTAMTAANNGAKTVLVGTGPVAGTCLNTGCIPTKAMLHAADILRSAQTAEDYGIHATAEPDFPALMRRVQGIIHEGRSHAEHALTKTENLTYVEGRARFVAKKTIEVNHKRISADTIIIATGTRPGVPPIPGLEEVDYWTNEDVVALKELPQSLIIVGGGYIACEFATFFSTLGTRVTILERAPDILSVLDEDLRETVRASLEDAGVRILCGVATTKATQTKKSFTCSLSGADLARVSADALLVAAGRIPNTDGLGLREAGIDIDGRGFIPVDRQLRTSAEGVYAIGDVNGKDLFAHAAKREGWLALEHSLLHKRVRTPAFTPWAVFTHPPVAGFGRSEQDLRRAGETYEVLEAPMRSCGKARIIGAPEGKVKILHRAGHILGAFIVGVDADNLIHEFVALSHLGADALSALREMVHIHPTLAEVHENLRPRA